MRRSSNIFDDIMDFCYRYSFVPKCGAIFLLVCLLIFCWKIGGIKEEEKVKLLRIPESFEDMQHEFPYLALSAPDINDEPEDPVYKDLSECDGTYEIREGGCYRLSGKMEGSIHILAKDQNVQLFLDNAEVISPFGPAIYCEDAGKLVITLPEGTESIISDTPRYPEEKGVEACIYSTCDLTFNGTGKLLVNAFFKDAIRSKDITKILDGVYQIKCKRTGIHGNDGVLIKNGRVLISSEKFGMRTANAGIDGRGDLVVSGGDITIIAGKYAFETAKGRLLVFDCVVNEKSILGTYNVGGAYRIEEGCIQ